MTTENGAKVIVVKNWVVVLTTVLWLTGAVLSYGHLQGQTQDNTRRLDKIEQQAVTRERFDEFQQDTQRRLERIERKIDEERSLRELYESTTRTGNAR